jgi:hypothetical protein
MYVTQRTVRYKIKTHEFFHSIQLYFTPRSILCSVFSFSPYTLMPLNSLSLAPLNLIYFVFLDRVRVVR